MTRAAPFTRPSGGWRPAVASAVENLSPGAFAFVMATGIVSTAFARPGMRTASVVLALIAVVGYVVLWALYLWRLVRWRQRFLADLAGSRGFAFLTFVAASDVLATRLTLGRRYGAAEVLLALGVAGWLVLGYGVPLLLICARRALPLRQVNGTWFLWVVGTESIAVAAASLAPHTGGRMLGALASVCWAIGLVQYLLTAVLALAGLLLEPVAPAELVPPYWVFMGAAAITVLAGARLLQLPTDDALLPRTFVLGVSAVQWSFCTWLIPLLLALGVWRHVLRGVPLRYDASLWSLVFPVGMYGVATMELGHVGRWGWMAGIGSAEAWAALAVWAATFIGMLAAAATALRRTGDPGSP
ncbi:tellurite resistance/C4-dicarboxylate transporter family protein [Streptomyces malaysiensis]|uniref:Tellurite resistance/C4-dicarboxylate transporter family protein n=1 Tax=Streptomyces malaysiensis subsp. samsunensis TaxID=459658 RepID=A0A9X2LSL9_STRMQ|nr:tellurite resistance/C4-dicarboxylate transporter family protein [Streptomyces samsunensis]MCQ8828550.1 tellurite resistance/C4-dicarboxylate transporter family protein [Streptomyces samsunensis]